NYYSALPRAEIVNDQANQYYTYFEAPWIQNYRAISAAAQGLQSLSDPELAAQLDASRLARARAFAKFVLGLAHGQIALLYDQGFIVDETTDVNEEQQAVGYNEMLEAAIGYLDEAIALSQGESFT